MELEKLLENLISYYKQRKNSPWSMYMSLTEDEVIENFNIHGYEDTKEMIRRADIRACRQEEAMADNI